MTFLLFAVLCAAIVFVWNRFYQPVPRHIAILFFAIVCAYQATTLFTTRVDLPANLAFAAYPWKALGRPASTANTGIVLTQIAPWTHTAANAIRQGEWPLWNRYSGSGTALLANQQTAIFHPFTLAGFLVLSPGKAFTFTGSIRLFTLLFFTFLFFRGLQVKESAAVFGAIAYTFCTFHIVWLLFPLGLATMMLPIALVGIQEIVRGLRLRAYLLLTLGLSLSVLGGHPESSFWVWTFAAAYALFKRRRLIICASAFILAAVLTAMVWMPTVALLPRMERAQLMSSAEANPPDHKLGPDWLAMLIAPNILGTPQSGTWAGPSDRHPAVLDDYGEIASGYAGIVTIALAMASLITIRRKEVWFFAGVMLFVYLTIAEAPLWRDALRWLPVVGLTLHQRLRAFWALAAVALATFAIDHGVSKRMARITAIAVLTLIFAIYAWRAPESTAASITLLATSAAAIAFFIAPSNTRLITIVTFTELFVVTYRFNPSARARDVLPVTGAIRAVRSSDGSPHRMVALGWSFLPDTPGHYSIEDVKTTDPIADAHYKRLMLGFLHVVPSYDQIVGDTSEPFFDFLNVRYLYVPPDVPFSSPTFAVRYHGKDGSVYENTEALPRYFVAPRYVIDPWFERAIPKLKEISSFREHAVVDHVPDKVSRVAPQLLQEGTHGTGVVRVINYRHTSTTLDITTTGWSLLASSDTHWPGWRAYVNGERQPPVTVNGAFLGCFVPPGRSRVEFRYRPAEFDDGLRLSALGLLIVLLLIAIRSKLSGRRFGALFVP